MKNGYNVTVINYADSNFTDAQRLNTWTARHIGKADRVIEFGPNDIDQDFRNAHVDILRHEKGGGYWLWKPYIVYHSLLKAYDGDYIFYLDSGCIFLKRLCLFVDFMKSKNLNLLCFYTPFPEIEWDKKVLFDKYSDYFDIEKNILQIEGEYICLRKCPDTVAIVKEWLDSCTIAENILDLDLNLGENHRHDQSNFSLVCKKHGIKAFSNPSNRYVKKNFDGKLLQFYKNENEMKKYKKYFFSLEEIPGTKCAIFSHSRRNAPLYLLRVLKTMFQSLYKPY